MTDKILFNLDEIYTREYICKTAGIPFPINSDAFVTFRQRNPGYLINTKEHNYHTGWKKNRVISGRSAKLLITKRYPGLIDNKIIKFI